MNQDLISTKLVSTASWHNTLLTISKVLTMLSSRWAWLVEMSNTRCSQCLLSTRNTSILAIDKIMVYPDSSEEVLLHMRRPKIISWPLSIWCTHTRTVRGKSYAQPWMNRDKVTLEATLAVTRWIDLKLVQITLMMLIWVLTTSKWWDHLTVNIKICMLLGMRAKNHSGCIWCAGLKLHKGLRWTIHHLTTNIQKW